MSKRNEANLKIQNICCIGAGYVGGPTMAVIAEMCPFLNIFVVDTNKARVDLWNSSDIKKLPIYEPGLDEIIMKVRNKNLFFSCDVNEKIKNADMIFISVNTPIKTKGVGAGKASDLRWVEASARNIAKEAKGHTIVVEKSTLPVKTARVIKEILDASMDNSKDLENKKTFSVLSNPEFLAEGTAIHNLKFPDRVLIGGEDENSITALKNIYLKWVDEKKILTTNLWSSELSKLIANAFLAQRISSINSVSAICEVTGANVNEVSKAVGFDSRIGSDFLNAGPGFGGSCFKKDILNLVYLCGFFGLETVAQYWEQIININSWQQNRIFEIVLQKLFGNVSNKKIAILGFAFKANTNDTRESPSIHICKNLLNEGAYLLINDPKVKEESIENELSNETKYEENNIKKEKLNWKFESDLEIIFDNVDAVIILTEWEIYKEINWQKLSNKLRKPAWIFDTRFMLKAEELEKYGINLWQLGVGKDI